MKALTDRLEWVRLYIIGTLGDRDDEKNRQLALDEILAAHAIADALPEISCQVPSIERGPNDPLLSVIASQNDAIKHLMRGNHDIAAEKLEGATRRLMRLLGAEQVPAVEGEKRGFVE